MESSKLRKLQRAYTGTYLELSAPTKDQGVFTRYAQFTSRDATNGSSNRNYLLQDNGIIYVPDDVGSLPQQLGKSYKALYGSMGGVHDGGTEITDRTIRDYHCELSQSAPDWTTESAHCEE